MDASWMNGWKSLFVSLVLSVILSVGVSYVFAPAFMTPSSDGSVGQSPILYIVIILAILVLGGIFHFVFRPTDGSSFNFWLFVCVALSGLMIGGIIHEFTHVVLISHPTQFRVHFGDSSSILSTCCLNPGEYDYELLAYGIQFLVMIGWIFAFREYFTRVAPASTAAPASHPKSNFALFMEEPHRVSEKEDPEWAEARREAERLLRKSRHMMDDSSMSESPDLHHLKVPKRE